MRTGRVPLQEGSGISQIKILLHWLLKALQGRVIGVDLHGVQRDDSAFVEVFALCSRWLPGSNPRRCLAILHRWCRSEDPHHTSCLEHRASILEVRGRRAWRVDTGQGCRVEFRNAHLTEWPSDEAPKNCTSVFVSVAGKANTRLMQGPRIFLFQALLSFQHTSSIKSHQLSTSRQTHTLPWREHAHVCDRCAWQGEELIRMMNRWCQSGEKNNKTDQKCCNSFEHWVFLTPELILRPLVNTLLQWTA